MPDSPLVAAGAQITPTNAAALFTNTFFMGMWTQGNPLGSGAVPFLQQKYYSATRFDRLVGGENVEVTTRLTLARRPGNSIYNSSLFPPINRFFCWRGFADTQELIRIISSVDPATGSNQGTVRDVTGPTNNIILWTKDKNAGRTSFVAVGNILYSGDGVNTRMLVQSNKSWGVASDGTPTTIGAISTVQLYRLRLGPPPSPISTIAVFTLTVPPVATLINGQQLTLSGLTLALPLLNGATFTYNTGYASFVPVASNQIALDVSFIYHTAMANTAETGTISAPAASFNAGDFIIDSNGNIQEAVGAQVANIANIQVEAYTVGGSPGRLVTLFLSPSTPLNVSPGVHLHLAGLTTVPGLNSTFPAISTVGSSLLLKLQIAGTALPITAFAVETGTADTGSGVSAPGAPVWATTPGAVTIDGGQQWVCKGPAVQDWGFTGPTIAPTVTQVAAPSIYNQWQANTWYSPNAFVIIDSNGNLQQLNVPGGTTGGSAPTWSTVIGVVTNDNTAHWTCKGPAAWASAHAYVVGDIVQATFSYQITQEVPIPIYPWHITQTQTITVTSAFRCTTAGTSGPNTPPWTNGLQTLVSEPAPSTVVWQNIGQAPVWPGAAQSLSTDQVIEDSNNYLQQPHLTAKTGAVAPTWKTKTGEYTPDTPQLWLNTGPYTPAGTEPWIYAYSGKSSITQQVSTASPLSLPITPSPGNQVVIQGLGVPNPPMDLIVIWRTLAGGSTLFELDEFPNPGTGQIWTYTDTTPDLPGAGSDGLNQLIVAPIAGENNPPPHNFVPQCYYLTRIWGFVGNVLRWSAGPDQAGTAGSGDQSFHSKDFFTLPSLGVKCWPTSIGLIVFTNSDIFALLGQGTDTSPFYVITFQEGVGLGSQDAFCVNGSTAYGMLTSGQVVSMDPGAGEVEVGFPIGDLFNQQYTPQATYCAWHMGSSADMALYVADGTTGWYRMAAVAAPEQGNVWSTQGLITNGIKAIASVEISPGLRGLLMSSSQQDQPILIRDRSTWQDNSNNYEAFADIGVITLAQPGTVVGVEFVVTEEPRIPGATPIRVGILNDEIVGVYSNLRNVTTDPPNLPLSNTILAQRHWAAQDANTILPCRYFQQQLYWPAENFPNELLTNTVYGRMPDKSRR